jgi:hypothetical protein
MSDHKPGKDARSRILGDLRPVRPLNVSWKRLVVLYVPCAAALLVVLVLSMGLRPNIHEIGVVWSWCGSALFLVCSFTIALCALRESIPAAGFPAVYTVGLFVMTLASRIAFSSALHAQHPCPVAEGDGFRVAIVCSVWIFALAMPWTLLLACLIRRGMPPRGTRVVILAGGAAVIAGEALWRLHCPFTSPVHLLLSHFPPYVLVFALLLFVSRLKRSGSTPPRDIQE